MKHTKQIMKLIAMCMMCIYCLAACTSVKPAQIKDDGSYYIYYLNSAGTGLYPYTYKPTNQGTDIDLMIPEFMTAFMNVPQDVDATKSLDDKVIYKGYTVEDKILYLYFDANYTAMKPAREILCRAALTKTMTQIPGIEYIGIYSGDQPLTDSLGNPVGVMSSADYLDSISNVNSFDQTELTLYYSDVTGNELVPEKREVIYNINTSIEKLVIEQLLEGPETEGSRATIPQNAKLLNVSVNESICYINFDSGFLEPMLDEKDYITIYSIVNSLTELPSVSKVQISVNGSQDVLYRDSISLSNAFERNDEHVIE